MGVAPVPQELKMWAGNQRLAQKQEITGQAASTDWSFQMRALTLVYLSIFIPYKYDKLCQWIEKI